MNGSRVWVRWMSLLFALSACMVLGCSDNSDESELLEECEFGGSPGNCDSDPPCDQPRESYPESSWCNPGRYEDDLTDGVDGEDSEECEFGGSPGSCVSDPPCDRPRESYPEGSWCNPPRQGGDATDGTDVGETEEHEGESCEAIGELDVFTKYLVGAEVKNAPEGRYEFAFLIEFSSSDDSQLKAEVSILNQAECPYEEGCEDFEPRKPNDTARVSSDVAVDEFDTYKMNGRLDPMPGNLPSIFQGSSDETLVFAFTFAACSHGAICGDGVILFEDGDVVTSIGVTVGSVHTSDGSATGIGAIPTSCDESAAVAAGDTP